MDRNETEDQRSEHPRAEDGARRPVRARAARGLMVALLAVATGAWLLGRGLAGAERAMPWLAAWSVAAQWRQAIGASAVVAGAGLLVAAVALSDGRAWGWLVAAAMGLAAMATVVLAWAQGGTPDWVALLLTTALLLALAAPSVRADFLGE